MQKVYLLLRNNRQSGPFTLDELCQQQPRPTDMVWIEGLSTAWCYLSELELKPSEYVGGSPDTTSASPRDEIERKAEELRRRALVSTAPLYDIRMEPVPVIKKADRKVDDDEDGDAIDFVDHRKEKKNVFGELLMTGVIIALFAGGIYSGNTFFKDKRSGIVPPVTKLVSDDRHEAAVIQPLVKPHDSAATTNISQPSPSIDSTRMIAEEKPKVHVTRQQSAKETTAIKPAPVIPVTVAENAAAGAENLQVQVPDSTKKEATVETKPAVATEQPEKKRGFLKNIFRKKKKNEEKAGDDINGSGQENN